MAASNDILADSTLVADEQPLDTDDGPDEKAESRKRLWLNRASSLPLIAALLAPLSTLLDIPAMTVRQCSVIYIESALIRAFAIVAKVVHTRRSRNLGSQDQPRPLRYRPRPQHCRQRAPARSILEAIEAILGTCNDG